MQLKAYIVKAGHNDLKDGAPLLPQHVNLCITNIYHFSKKVAHVA
jgi:hypothetical protein